MTTNRNELRDLAIKVADDAEQAMRRLFEDYHNTTDEDGQSNRPWLREVRQYLEHALGEFRRFAAD